jgi:peptidoglycan/LPS O-acetylase OafA/YrhL
LLLLLSGAFNTWRAWGDYKLNRPLMHGLWGPHLFLALTAIVIALFLLAGKTPPKWHKKGAAINLVILFLAVAVASTLKYVHDQAVRERPIQLPAGMPSSR